MRAQRPTQGFVMPIVIVLTTVMMIVLFSLLQTITSFRTASFSQYYTKIAEEAAEAGVQYASACLELNNRIQTWGNNNSPLNKLTQNSNCSGNQASFPGNSVIASDNRIKSTFTVGNLESSTSNSVLITATGKAEVKSADGLSAIATYTHVLKKSITWPSDLVGTKSASGTNRTCAIVSGSVYCWGYNAYGQLGNGQYLGSGGIDSASAIDSLIPVKVKKDAGLLSGKTVTDIFVAQYHSCALASGKVYCWGYNSTGQLGNGTTTSNGSPYEVGGALAGKTVTAIGGTANTSCAIADSKIYCWGSNANGTVGVNAASGTYTTPQLVVAGNTATTLPTAYIATGLSTSGSRSNTMCAIAGGKAYCWGTNNAGQIGDGTTTRRNLPTKVTDTGVLSGKTVTSISQDGYMDSSAYAHTCAVASGLAYCWGENNYGQLGRAASNTSDSSVPVAVSAAGVLNGKVIQDIAVGLRHSCARATNQVYCWGQGSSGQVGDNTSNTRYVPVTVYQEAGGLLGATVTALGAGANRACAVVSTGRSFCWGLNNTGQIGDGTNTNRHKPTESLFLRPDNNEYIY